MQTDLSTVDAPDLPPCRPPPADDWQARVEAALAHAFRVALPRANACVSSRLGYGSPVYARSFSHGYETLWELAKDLCGTKDRGRYFEAMIADRTGVEGSWDRTAAEMRETRALALVEHVLRLPKPQQEVVVLRASGMEWRKIVKALPGRAYFSLVEDYMTALRGIWERADDLVTQTAH